jgi:deoxyribodipyrimidine photolyase-related protein
LLFGQAGHILVHTCHWIGQMKTLRIILGDHLSQQITALQDLDPAEDVVLLMEVAGENTYVKHHKQKIVLVLSAMRHFAQELRSRGITVDYVHLDEEGNTGSFTGELGRALGRHRVDKVVVTEPGEWRVLEMVQDWQTGFSIPVEMRSDGRFLCSRADFTGWAKGRKDLRMEFFYRYMRRQTGWLMDGEKPTGGNWNYDSQNRRSLPPWLIPPPTLRFKLDDITSEVMALVSKRFTGHFGDLQPFGWAVTRENALEALRYFTERCLPQFGTYQDAMKSGEDFIFHSALSPYINLGLLEPREVCQAALDAYNRGAASLPSVEGFIRQILGWREFVRGVYWTHMPAYRQGNFFDAQRPLPAFYWTGETAMNCLREAVANTRRNCYAHHIQRLMLTGNFALLAGISPCQVEEWYLSVYADAFEWVELPNTHGMALHADGGMLGSKPYAASGSYINRMSDYCSTCTYDPKVKTGSGACPFNYLYWHFLISHQAQLSRNPRMGITYATLARMDPLRRAEANLQARQFLAGLDSGYMQG